MLWKVFTTGLTSLKHFTGGVWNELQGGAFTEGARFDPLRRKVEFNISYTIYCGGFYSF
jgi:hypothetical protein